MNSIKNLEWRYAVKKFDSEKSLTEQQLHLLKQAFNLTATSYGLQPIKLVIVSDKKIKEKLLPHSWNQPQIVQASHIFVFCVAKELTKKHVDEYFERIKEVRKTTDEVLSGYKTMINNSLTSRTEEELFQWTKNQAYIALGNLLTVAANQRIDTCPMEGFVPEKYDEILGLSERNLRSVVLLSVGFRDDDDKMNGVAKVRRKLEDMVIEIS